MAALAPMGPGASAAPTFLREAGVRRQLRAELTEIEELIRRSPFTDPMTQEISHWCTVFLAELGRRDSVEGIKQEFIHRLQGLLQDPFTRQPLDMTALLGSDGRTYSELTMQVCQRIFSEPYATRSPVDRENTAPLTLTPHHVVRHLLRWLRQHGAYQHSLRLEEVFHRMIQPPPRVVDHRTSMQRLAARQISLQSRERGPAAGPAQAAPEPTPPARRPAGPAQTRMAEAQARLEANALAGGREVERLLAAARQLRQIQEARHPEMEAQGRAEDARLAPVIEMVASVERALDGMSRQVPADHERVRRDIEEDRQRTEEIARRQQEERAAMQPRLQRLESEVPKLKEGLQNELKPEISKMDEHKKKLQIDLDDAKREKERADDTLAVILTCIGIIAMGVSAAIAINVALHAAAIGSMGATSNVGAFASAANLGNTIQAAGTAAAHGAAVPYAGGVTTKAVFAAGFNPASGTGVLVYAKPLPL